MQAKGSFEVKVIAQTHVDGVGDPNVARMSLDKQFHGELEATSKGQMLASGNPATGAGGYVAMEYVTGVLSGKTGAFALHTIGDDATRRCAAFGQCVPDSGNGELTGLGWKNEDPDRRRKAPLRI
jgi:hypothetical protein